MEYSTSVRLPFLDRKVTPKLRDGDHEKRGYRYAWRLFAQVADSMGVEVTQQDKEHWRTLLGITRGLDDMIDEESCEDITPALSSLFEGKPVGAITPKEAADFKKCMAAYSEEVRQDIAYEIIQLGEFAKVKQKTSSANELVESYEAEAEWYASLLALREGNSSDIHQRQQFNEWLRNFITSGYFIDGVLDIEDDFNQGNIGVEPSLASKKALASAAIKETIGCLRKTPKRRLGAIAFVAYRNVHPVKSKHPA